MRRLRAKTALLGAATLTLALAAPAAADDPVDGWGQGDTGGVTITVPDKTTTPGSENEGGGDRNGSDSSGNGSTSSGGNRSGSASGGGGNGSSSGGGGNSGPSIPTLSPSQSISIPGRTATGATCTEQVCSLPSAEGLPADQGTPIVAADPADPAAPAPEAAPAPAPVDPVVVAEVAVEQMDLQAGAIGSNPSDVPGTIGAVGLPVWLWVEDPGPTTTGPQSETVTVGATTVTATASLDRIEYDMGDGTVITCNGTGTPYPGYGVYESPDCGHIYHEMSDSQPDDKYTITANSIWNVDWESTTGAAGGFPLSLVNQTQVTIGSYQTVVTS